MACKHFFPSFDWAIQLKQAKLNFYIFTNNETKKCAVQSLSCSIKPVFTQVLALVYGRENGAVMMSPAVRLLCASDRAPVCPTSCSLRLPLPRFGLASSWTSFSFFTAFSCFTFFLVTWTRLVFADC